MLLLVAPTAAHARAHRLLVVGDSLAEGSEPYMPDALPGWRIKSNARVGRHAPDGPRILQRASRLPRYVAVSLGTNDDPRLGDTFKAALRRTMRTVGDGRCVVWADIVRPAVAGTGYGKLNRVLRSQDRRRANLVVVRWTAMVRKHPEWLGRDGVHVNAAGYEARARAYARALARCP
jgi:lysophospholipase L1-like esterase